MKPALALALLPLFAALPVAAAPQWTLAWSDEFDGPAGVPPDAKKWSAETGDNGWGNQELEYYCAPGSTDGPCDPAKPNAALDGKGFLEIRAVRNSTGTWTSARYRTLGLAEFKYGRVEGRMRLPVGAGLWPAFWMMGADKEKVGWPACGEIDLMENVPAAVPGGLGPEAVKATVHYTGYSGLQGIGKVRKFPKKGRVDDGFHIYGALWSPGEVKFYVDDWRKPFLTVTKAGLPKGAEWGFDKPFYFLMNLAVGGSWPKDPAADTPNPATMVVDYVRVYKENR